MIYFLLISYHFHFSSSFLRYLLLGPHSDNGFPRPKARKGPASCILDAGREVFVHLFRNHNWYHGSFPSTASVFASSRERDHRAVVFVLCSRRFDGNSIFSWLPRDLMRLIGEMVLREPWHQILDRAQLEMCSSWTEYPLMPMQFPARYFKIIFHDTIDANSPEMSLGCIQLVSIKKT